MQINNFIFYRKRSQEKAEFFLDTVLAGLPILVLPKERAEGGNFIGWWRQKHSDQG